MRKKIFANKFIVACLVVSGLFGASFPVDAYFSDEEKSENYGFSLGTLDAGASFSEGGGFSSVDPSGENELGRKIEIKNQGSLDFQYRIEVRNESGEYCSELDLEADNLSNSGVECESSGLEGFECKAQNALATEKSETWELRLAKSGKDLDEAQECQFDLAVVAWQENMPNEEKGFWDKEILNEEITFAETESSVADHLVVNEIYIEGTDDWIELYNPNDESINLEDGNYRIERSTSSGGDPEYYMEFGETDHGAYPGGVMVPARGYYLITRGDANEDLKGRADAIIDSGREFALTEDNAVYLGVGPIGGKNDEDIVDFVGYGQSDDYEGGGPAPSLTESDTKSIQRKKAG